MWTCAGNLILFIKIGFENVLIIDSFSLIFEIAASRPKVLLQLFGTVASSPNARSWNETRVAFVLG